MAKKAKDTPKPSTCVFCGTPLMSAEEVERFVCFRCQPKGT